MPEPEWLICLLIIWAFYYGGDMPEWLVCLLIIWAFCYGWICAWASAHSHEPFWQAFLDGLTLRFLWDRRR